MWFVIYDSKSIGEVKYHLSVSKLTFLCCSMYYVFAIFRTFDIVQCIELKISQAGCYSKRLNEVLAAWSFALSCGFTNKLLRLLIGLSVINKRKLLFELIKKNSEWWYSFRFSGNSGDTEIATNLLMFGVKLVTESRKEFCKFKTVNHGFILFLIIFSDENILHLYVLIINVTLGTRSRLPELISSAIWVDLRLSNSMIILKCIKWKWVYECKFKKSNVIQMDYIGFNLAFNLALCV